MGKIDNLEAPSFKGSLKAYLDACRKYKKPAGMHIVRPDVNNIKKTIEEGYRMVALGLDVVFLEEKSGEMLAAANNIKETFKR